MDDEKNAFPLWVKTAVALAILVFLGSSAWFYRVQGQTMRQHAEDELTAIARLKVQQIADWRARCLADAAVLMERTALINDLKQFLEAPTPVNSRETLRRLRVLQKRYHYRDVLLMDMDKRLRLSLAGNTQAPDSCTVVMAEALRERKPLFTALYPSGQDSAIDIAVVAPLFAGEGAAATAIGALALVSDAAQFLYPLLHSWPIPSSTAETMLVTRDGDHALYLSDLRHQAHTTLPFRLPLSRTDSPAVQAVLGKQGLLQGRDYRGVEVLSVILPIPDSPWFMVAKMDTAELYAEWRFRAALMMIIMLAVAALLGACGLSIWQRNRKAHYKALAKAEANLRKVTERHSIILKAIGDGVIATDADGRVELLNPVAEELTGWRLEDALGRTMEDVLRIVNQTTRLQVECPVARTLREGKTVQLPDNTLLLPREGEARVIADSSARVLDEHGEVNGAVLVFRDATEEQRAKRITESRLALIEYATVHPLDEVLTEALDLIGALVGSPIGFYHFFDSETQTLSLQQWSTRTLQDFCRAQAKGRHYPLDQAGVWADAVREKRLIIHNDYQTLANRRGLPDGHAELVRELVVPVMRKSQVVAILGVGNKPDDYTENDAETVAYLADVTWEIIQRKQGEDALRESETLFRKLFENHVAVKLILDAHSGSIVDANQAAADFYGWSRQQLRQMRIQEINTLPADEIKRVLEEVRTGARVRFEFRHRRADGSIREVEVLSSKIEMQGKDLLHAIVHDITERKQVEAERQRLMTAIEQAGETIIVTDAAGTIQYINPAFEAVSGFSRAEALGKNPRIVKSGQQNEAFYRHLWQTIASGHMWRGRMVNRRKDGTLFTEDATISPVHDASGRIVNYVAVKHDITEQLRLAAEFQQAQKMESVGRLAGGVAHDYNNMLGVILGYTELALAKVEPGDALYGDLQEIFEAARRSTDITRQLLAFARQQTIKPKVVDLNVTIENMLKMLQRLIGEDIDLAWRPAKDLWSVKIDPMQVDQILANLCVNARDAIAGVGKVTIETENVSFSVSYCADHSGFISGEFVLLAVRDDGQGIAPEIVDKIFEPFFTTKEAGRGTGLGLSTVYGIVQQNNGFIKISSELGAGTTFRIYLPRHVGEAERLSPQQSEDIVPGCGETVLLVEDEPLLMKMVQIMLTRLDYHVLTSNRPGEAMRLVAEYEGKIDLLITDVVMPEMNGRDLARSLQVLYPSLKVLFMSGYTAGTVTQQGKIDEGVHFIEKPFSIQELAARVKAAMQQH